MSSRSELIGTSVRVLTLLWTVSLASGVALPAPRLAGLQHDAGRAKTSPSRELTTPAEAVGACRATCIEQTLAWPPTNDACLGTTDCLHCWEMCGHLYLDEYKWRPTCTDDEQCSQGFGCSIACKYSFTSVSMPDVMPMTFPETPITIEENANLLSIEWKAPVSLAKVKDDEPHNYYVYTLLFRDDNNPQWTQFITTTEQSTTVDGPHATFRGLQFLLIASSPLGTVARDHPPYPSAVPEAAPPATTRRPTESRREPTPAPTASSNGPAPFDQFPAKMSGLSVRTMVGPDGSLEAEITWSQDIPSSQQFVYNIQWTLVTCNIDPTMPVCHIQGQEKFAIQVKTTPKTDMRLVLTSLIFNSKYVLNVGFQGADTSDQTVFYTPPCPTVDATYKTCISSKPVTDRTTTTDLPDTTPTKSPTTVSLTTSGSTTTTVDPLPGLLPLLLKARAKDGLPETLPLVLLSTGVTFGSFIIILVVYTVYKRCVRRPDPEAELAKVLQSYSHLPLLGTGPGSLSQSLHHLHLHNALSQNYLNMSHGTPNSVLTTPTQLMSSPSMSSPSMLSPQLQQYQQNSMSAPPSDQQWRSMEALSATPTNRDVQSAVASQARSHGYSPLMMLAVQQSKSQVPKQDTVVNMGNLGSPNVTTLTKSAQQITPTSRSMECLNSPMVDVKRSRSYTDLSPSSQQKTARRQINFSNVQAQPTARPQPTIVVSPPVDTEVCTNPRFLQTVYEEGWVDDENQAEEGQFGEVLEWDYNVMSVPFRNRVETV